MDPLQGVELNTHTSGKINEMAVKAGNRFVQQFWNRANDPDCDNIWFTHAEGWIGTRDIDGKAKKFHITGMCMNKGRKFKQMFQRRGR